MRQSIAPSQSAAVFHSTKAAIAATATRPAQPCRHSRRIAIAPPTATAQAENISQRVLCVLCVMKGRAAKAQLIRKLQAISVSRQCRGLRTED